MLEQKVIKGFEPAEDYALQYPLSHGQARLWFLEKLRPGSSFYNLPLAVQLPGRLNRQALGLALNEVVRRHETLRCHVDEHDEMAVCIVQPFRPFALPFTDLSGLTKSEHAKQLADLTAQEVGRPFDLTAAPLVRFRLVKLAGSQHLFMATMHHIISDGWSMGVFWRELTSLYADAAAGRPPQLPEADLQYGDFAVWQREQLGQDVLGEQRRYWADMLDGYEQLDLPTDFPRPPAQKHNGATHPFAFQAALSKAVVAVSQKSDTTPFAVLLSCLGLVLGSFAGQTDVIIGTPVANRDREELENLIGFLVNSLVLRLDLSGEPDFATVLDRTSRRLRDALSNSDYPFEKLVEDLNVPRDPSRNPIYQVSAQLFSGPGQKSVDGQAPRAGGQSLMPIDKGTALFDMTWNFWFEGAVLKGQVEFDTDLFDPRRIEAMAGSLQALLEAALAQPDRAVRTLPLTRARPEAEIVGEDATAETVDIWQQIESALNRRSQDKVLEFGETNLTGAEVTLRVKAIAAGLQALGIGREDIIALKMPRSDELVLAMLGILAAGGVFLPLNPDDPPARHASILSRAGCRLTIYAEGDAKDDATTTVGLLEADANDFKPVPPLSDDQLAYLILTSGSTGEPKAVAQTHGAIARQIEWLTGFFSPSAEDAVLMKTPLVFDASLWEVLLPLSAGCRLVVAPPDAHRDPRQIVAAVAERQITILQLVPSMMRLVLDDLNISSCTNLRILAAGGEALDPALVTALQETLPSCYLVNLYGPAETCVQSAVAKLEPGTTQVPNVSASVGGHRLYLLGPDMQPLPDGHPGELWIGGVGVARGYMNAPAMTATSFIPDPFAADGSRMYRSGDRFLRRPDGTLAYLGRRDSQIKRSGIRIETGELESAARDHPDVSRAAVLIKENVLVLFAETCCTGPELRNFLQTRLPRQMMPDQFVPIEQMPILVSGKVDRQALAGLTLEAATATERAPRSKVDEAVAMIWADIFNREDVHIDQDFFAELGGHSLLAIRATVLMRDLLGLEFPLHLIFDAPTVAGLVDAIADQPDAGERLEAIEEALAT